jgi:hypothetical protein
MAASFASFKAGGQARQEPEDLEPPVTLEAHRKLAQTSAMDTV